MGRPYLIATTYCTQLRGPGIGTLFLLHYAWTGTMTDIFRADKMAAVGTGHGNLMKRRR